MKNMSRYLRIVALAFMSAALAVPHAYAQVGINSVSGYNLPLGAGGNVYLAIGTAGAVSIGTTNSAGMGNIDNKNFNGILNITSSGNVGIGVVTPLAALDVNGALQLEGSTSGYSAIKSPAAAGNVTWTLPSVDGASGQVLITNGSGTLVWGSSSSSTPTHTTSCAIPFATAANCTGTCPVGTHLLSGGCSDSIGSTIVAEYANGANGWYCSFNGNPFVQTVTVTMLCQ